MTPLDEIIERIDEHLDPALRQFKFEEDDDAFTTAIQKPIVCNKGVIIDIQASQTRACVPANGQGPWSEVEIVPYYSGQRFDQFKTYWSKGAKCYQYVPIELVAQVILDHGGIKDAI